jgi:hypothetical protein
LQKEQNAELAKPVLRFNPADSFATQLQRAFRCAGCGRFVASSSSQQQDTFV